MKTMKNRLSWVAFFSAWVVLLKSLLCSSLQIPTDVSRDVFRNSRGRISILSALPDDTTPCSDRSRRSCFISAMAMPSALLLGSLPAHAGLMQFPANNLKNRYHFMRAGLSNLEVDNIYSTNPLFLTNRENSMSDSAQRSVLEACRIMKDSGHFPTVAYHSLAANGMDTGDLIARELRLGRDRLLPEFTYLDQRGIGIWDSTKYDSTKKAIVALDFLEAGKEGTGGRPPPNEDGTPNETLADQFVRLRQFLSLQESRTSGENILVIFPDGTGPALLSCMIAGLPLNECHCLDYAPGEIRLDITRESVTRMFRERREDPAYLAMIEEGRKELAEMREELSSGHAFVSFKDQMANEKDKEVEQAFLREKQRQRDLERQKQEEILRVKQEQKRAKEEQERIKQEQRLEKQLLRKQQLAEDQQTESMAAFASSRLDLPSVALTFGVAIAGLGVLAANNVDSEEASSRKESKAFNGTSEANVVSSESWKEPLVSISIDNTTNVTMNDNLRGMDEEATPSSSSMISGTPALSQSDHRMTDDSLVVDSVDEELKTLEAAKDRFKAALLESEDDLASLVKNGASQPESERKRAAATVRSLDNDGSDDWLRVLAEIRDESDD